MDAWERMFIDERKELDFFLSEEFKELQDMEQSDTYELRKWAEDLYGQAAGSTPEEAIALQCIIQTRIAEHLARVAVALEKISKRLEES